MRMHLSVSAALTSRVRPWILSIQGLSWYAARLQQDQHGDLSHEFLNAEAVGSRGKRKQSKASANQVGWAAGWPLMQACLIHAVALAACMYADCMGGDGNADPHARSHALLVPMSCIGT